MAINDFILIAETLKNLMFQNADLRTESDGLRGMVKDLNIKIEEEKSKNRPGHRYSDASNTAAPVTTIGRGHHGVPITPPAHRAPLPEAFVTPTPRQTIPSTPTSQIIRSGSVNHSTGRRTGDSTRGRHRRTQTPTQSAIRHLTGGQPLHTLGMDPQDDRGLLTDFFDAIKAWAQAFTSTPKTMTKDKIAGLLTPGSVVFELLNTADGAIVLADDFLRIQLVAALVSYDIVYHTLCENFLHVSGFPEAVQADVLFNEYARLGEGNEMHKHEVLMRQKALYTAIKEQPGHRKLRSSMAKEFAEVMVARVRTYLFSIEMVLIISQLGHLLREAPTKTSVDADDRDHALLDPLLDLYIKGYRIGFRMRMESAKWSMSWPSAGEDFDGSLMISESRMLHGDPIKTLHRITQAPANYAVRFAMSPTISKTVFGSGVEDKEIVHKGMVHLICRANYIGAERGLYSAGFRH